MNTSDTIAIVALVVATIPTIVQVVLWWKRRGRVKVHFGSASFRLELSNLNDLRYRAMVYEARERRTFEPWRSLIDSNSELAAALDGDETSDVKIVKALSDSFAGRTIKYTPDPSAIEFLDETQGFPFSIELPLILQNLGSAPVVINSIHLVIRMKAHRALYVTFVETRLGNLQERTQDPSGNVRFEAAFNGIALAGGEKVARGLLFTPISAVGSVPLRDNFIHCGENLVDCILYDEKGSVVHTTTAEPLLVSPEMCRSVIANGGTAILSPGSERDVRSTFLQKVATPYQRQTVKKRASTGDA